MGFRITISECGSRATIHFRGPLNFEQVFSLYQHCQLEEFNFKRYCINLSRVTALTEAGLSSLRTFVRWSHERGIEVQVVTALPAHSELCRQWGISVYAAVASLSKTENSDEEFGNQRNGAAHGTVSARGSRMGFSDALPGNRI